MCVALSGRGHRLAAFLTIGTAAIYGVAYASASYHTLQLWKAKEADAKAGCENVAARSPGKHEGSLKPTVTAARLVGPLSPFLPGGSAPYLPLAGIYHIMYWGKRLIL